MNGPWRKSSSAIVRSPAGPCATTTASSESRAAPSLLRVRVGDRAAHGAAVANDRVGDLRCGAPEDAIAALQERGALAGLVAHESADPQPAAVLGEQIEPLDAIDVDERRRSGHSELHRRDDALAARQHLGLSLVALEDRKRFGKARRSEVLEGRRIHRRAPSRGRSHPRRSRAGHCRIVVRHYTKRGGGGGGGGGRGGARRHARGLFSGGARTTGGGGEEERRRGGSRRESAREGVRKGCGADGRGGDGGATWCGGEESGTEGEGGGEGGGGAGGRAETGAGRDGRGR